MNIELNANMRTPQAVDLTAAGAKTESAPERAGWKAAAKGVEDLVSIGGEIEVPDDALARDDALGSLVNRAFGL